MVAEQQMAYPPYFSNNLSLLLGFILPLFLVLSFAFIVPPILKRIVYEKETGVKASKTTNNCKEIQIQVCFYFVAGVDEVDGASGLDALAVLVHQCCRHLLPLRPHHRHPCQHRVQDGDRGCLCPLISRYGFISVL